MNGLRSFIKQQINDGEVGLEPELILKDLIIWAFKTIAVVWFPCFLGMDFQAGIVLFVGGECLGAGNFCVNLQTFQQRLGELEVEVEQEFVFLFKKGFQGIFVIEIEGGVVVSGLDGTPVGSLPRGNVLDAHLLHHAHSLVMDGGDDEVQHPVAVLDDGPVAIRLFLIPFFPINKRIAGEEKGKILNWWEIGGGKQVLFHLYREIISLDL